MQNRRKIANHACMNERFFWNFIWREATSRCSVSGIEMGLWIDKKIKKFWEEFAMLNTIFSSVFTETIAAFTFGQFLACTAVSLILGLLIAAVYRYKSECTKALLSRLFWCLWSYRWWSCSSMEILEPESLDYTSVFDDIFARYLTRCELVQVKTTNMGSLFKLEYRIVFREEGEEKNMIDQLRCRNGNLEILCSRAQTGREEL